MSEWLSQLAWHWWWVGAGALLGILEILLPGIFLIWIGAAAILTGLATLAFGLSIALQFTVFAVAAIVALYAGRRWLRLHPIETSDPMLNDRAARLIGRTVIVTEVGIDGGLRVRVGDSVWNASGPPVPIGTRLRVVSVDGSTLELELLSPAAEHAQSGN